MKWIPATSMADFYKFDHRPQYPKKTEYVYSTWTARISRIPGIVEVVATGTQAFAKKILIDFFNENFFAKSKEQIAIDTTLAKYPKARKIPVENVAYWSTDKFANYMNFEADKACYGWKGDTLKAIRHVLKIQGKI